MGFSVQIPVPGQPFSSEGVKVGNALTTITQWGNGNIVDTDLKSPTSTARKLVFSLAGILGGNLAFTPAGQPFLIPSVGSPFAAAGSSSNPVPMFPGDGGISGNPVDFNNVPNKTCKARLRGAVVCNGQGPGAVISFQLMTLNTLGGGAGTVAYNFSPVAGTATNPITAAPSSGNATESPEFALPTDAGFYTIGLWLSGGGGLTAAGTFITLTCGLYVYHS